MLSSRRGRLIDLMVESLVHQNSRRILPKSLWFFVFTAAAYLLQHIPFLDAVLMILLALLWPIITINLGFVGIVMEAVSGHINKLWLVLPALYFGGNCVLAAASQMEFTRLEAQVQAFNQDKTLALSEAEELVIEIDDADSVPIPRWLATRYDIPVVFTRYSRAKQPSTVAIRIGAGDVCAQLRKMGPRNAQDIRVENILEQQPFVLGEKQRHQIAQGMCLYERPEVPMHATETVRIGKRIEQPGFLLPVTTQSIEITSANGRVVRLLSAQARPLNWLPLPIMGCLRGPGDSHRYCMADLLRIFPSTALSEDGEPTALVAQALRLQVAPASARREILKRQQDTAP